MASIGRRTGAGGRVPPAAALALAGALLGGCALPGAVGPDDAGDGPVRASESLMVEDLALAVEQLHPARTTTVQVMIDSDPLTENLVERLATAGYGIQRVDADQGARHLVLVATAERAKADEPAATRLELDVGPTRLARSYADLGESIRPASPMSVSGTRAALAVDDSRFGAGLEAANSRVERIGAAAVPERQPLISLITDDVVTGIALRASRGPTLAGVNSQRVEVPNLFYGDDDAFGSLSDAYAPAERTVVVFGNDSMRLGADGKRIIARFIESYREGEDLIGLIGCSNGPTSLEIGNEGLALGRSKRVAEELVALGIAPERVVDEGCWAPTSAKDRFPSRGVVMELLRKPS